MIRKKKERESERGYSFEHLMPPFPFFVEHFFTTPIHLNNTILIRDPPFLLPDSDAVPFPFFSFPSLKIACQSVPFIFFKHTL